MVFFDPPYASGLYGSVPELLSSLALISDQAMLVIECSSRVPVEERFGTLARYDRRVYGDTALEFFVRESQ
jgi:16S rRNA G966 N2-methylase RsmD